MPKQRLNRSLRKYIRKEKARIRREVLDLAKQEELINELYKEVFKNNSPNSSKEQKNENK